MQNLTEMNCFVFKVLWNKRKKMHYNLKILRQGKLVSGTLSN